MNKIIAGIIVLVITLFALFGINVINYSDNSVTFQFVNLSLGVQILFYLAFSISIGLILGIAYNFSKGDRNE